MSDVAAAKPANGNTFFGHPKGLQTLFFTEMWERFSYYGMRAFLVAYCIAPVSAGGLGWTDAEGGITYGMYGSLIYLMSVPGGWIADRFIGQRKAVLIGGIIIIAGHVTLALPMKESFLAGLGLLIIGTGFLKPNVSTIVGQLYDKSDPRRDAGYTIYYMGINIGALLAPIICGTLLAESDDLRAFLADNGISPNAAWHFGFGAAAVGMLFGVIQFVHGWKYLGEAGAPPRKKEAHEHTPIHPMVWVIAGIGAAVVLAFTAWHFSNVATIDKKAVADAFGVGLVVLSIVLFTIMHQYVARDADERRRTRAMMVLFLGCLSFFGLFEQAGSTLSIFAEKMVDRDLLGIHVEQSFYQSLNAAFVIMLAPLFAALWIALNKKGKEPTPVTKFAIGMVICGFSLMVLLPAMLGPVSDGEKTSGLYLFGVYFVFTLAELCISPVGLSTMNKLAPDRLAGFVMGLWFLATAIGYYIAGRAHEKVGGMAEDLGLHQHAGLFYLLILFAWIIALILFALSGPVKRMLSAEADLPQAKARGGH